MARVAPIKNSDIMVKPRDENLSELASHSEGIFAVQIEALLAEPELMREPSLWSWTWLLLAFLPLAAVPFHTCSHLSATH